MSSFKSLITVAILGGIGVGLYMKINSMPDPKPPKDFNTSWIEPPAIDMGGLPLTPQSMPNVPAAGNSDSGVAPAFSAAPGGTAPVFVPPSASGAAPTPTSSGSGAVPASANVEIPAPTGLTAAPADAASNRLPEQQNTSDPFSTRISGGSPPANLAPPTADRYAAAGAAPAGGVGLATHMPQQDLRGDTGGSSLNTTNTATAESLFYKTEHATFDEAWKEARALLEQRNLAGAHLMLSAWYNHPTLTPVEQEALLDLLSGLAGTVIYSAEHHLEPAYQPAPGETLDQIARRYQVSPELLAKINGIADPQHLPPNKPLKVVRGPFGAQVDATRNELVLVLGGRYAGRFSIGLGRERTDIEGRYEVKRKVTNPPYFGPDRTLEPGDPANPLGSHFLSLIKPLENEMAAPFGIHGTSDAANVQRDDARGYIRLSPHDIADCYDILSEKSQVIIRR